MKNQLVKNKVFYSLIMLSLIFLFSSCVGNDDGDDPIDVTSYAGTYDGKVTYIDVYPLGSNLDRTVEGVFYVAEVQKGLKGFYVSKGGDIIDLIDGKGTLNYMADSNGYIEPHTGRFTEYQISIIGNDMTYLHRETYYIDEAIDAIFEISGTLKK